MDSYHQSHPFMRAPPPPPPPSSADPYHHQQSSLRPPIPPQGPWFPNQFQYHPSHSPSPPPPPSLWGPPLPHSDHALPPPPPPPGSYPPPPHQYPAQPTPHNQFPPPRPHMFPYPPPHSQVPQSYSQVNQEWNNPNWASHQGWEYQAHSNEEDWAARARAWADAKTAMENQQSQFPPTGRLEEQNYYHDQYSQPINSNHPDISHQPGPPPTYEQFPVSAASVLRPPAAHHPESTPISSEPSSYLSDGRPTYSINDGNFRGNMNSVLNHQGNVPSSPSVHQQEVPSSNFSVTGEEGMRDQSEQSYKPLLSNASVQEGQPHFQPSVPTPYAYGNESADPTTNRADQPLDFAPRFSHDHGLRMQSGYARNDSAVSTRGIDSGIIMPSLTPWTSIAPGMVYPQIPSLLTSGTQLDPPVAVPSAVSGHTPPPFGRFPGSGMTPAIPSAAAPFAGTALPATVISGDTYGISNMPERPKKASVPNWLREEIKKAVITNSSADHSKEETKLMEDQGVDKSFAKGDQTDSKSVDSSRSTEEEEEEEEEYIEGARTAAINQEIKRVLTEVLLKVTDELFDEIATRVINEDDLVVEVKHNAVSSNQNVSPSPLPPTTPKSSAKVLIPVKVEEPYSDGTSEKSSSSSPGDVLGLANYVSDDENNDDKEGEIQSSNVQNSKTNIDIEPSSTKLLSNKMQDAVENPSSPVDVVQHIGNHLISERNAGATSSIDAMSNRTDINNLNGDWVDGEMGQEYSLKSSAKDKGNEVKLGGGTASGTKDISGIVSEHHGSKLKGLKDPEDREAKMKADDNGKQESISGSSWKDHLKEEEINTRTNEKTDEKRRKHDQRHMKKEETNDQNVQKEKLKDQGVKNGVKGKDFELRHRSTRHDSKEERREDKLLRANVKDGTDRKREYTKGKEEGRSRQKISSDSSRHKSSRERNKDKTVDRSTNSSDDSDDSKRKVNSRKRDKSPSPIRSKRRQVSRSPHSKHSQRRHSPFSSLETTRARSSRSRSPVRRRR